ncbi:MAG: FG-GAP-like repeat-containing protein [Actinomycetota bacterium]
MKRRLLVLAIAIAGLLNIAAATAQITSPAPGQTVSGPVPLVGTADATSPAFSSYVIEFGVGAAPVSWIPYGNEHTSPVIGGTLDTINTLRLTNQTYTFRLTTLDQGGGQASASVTVTISNAVRLGTPHGNYQLDSDICALCHATHTGIFAPGILRFGATKFQSQLCYTCHNGTGSIYDVATEFDTGSAHHPIKDTTYEGDPAHTLDCSDCHDSHGSEESGGRPYPRILRSEDTGGAVSYQGNTFCYSCHGENGKIVDRRYFETNNGHNNTDPNQTTVFPDPASGTKIKCSICHEPHGSQQANLRRDTDKNMCGASGCHPETPYTIRTDNEVVIGIGYPNLAFSQPYYAGLRLFSQDAFNMPPVSLKGPKEYRVFPLSFSPRLRGIAVGDATNHGKNDVVATIVDGGTNSLAVWTGADGGYALEPVKMFAGCGGYGVAVGDINLDGINETVVTTLGAPNEIKVLTIMGDAVIGANAYPTGGVSPRKVAIGDITGDGLNDVVVTNYGSNNVTVFKQSAGALLQVAPVAAGGAYTYGLAIGDVNADGKNEVVVANQGYQNQSSFNQDPPYSDDNVSVFSSDADGNLTLIGILNNGEATAGWDVAIGDVLDDSPGNEIVVVGHPLWPSGLTVNGRIAVFNLVDNSARVYDAGATDSKGVAVGDADADGKPDVVVLSANAVSVFSHGAADLAAPAVYSMAGMNTVGLAD